MRFGAAEIAGRGSSIRENAARAAPRAPAAALAVAARPLTPLQYFCAALPRKKLGV